MNKCFKCNQILDSNYQVMYLDRNGKLSTDSQVEAFKVLHPHTKNDDIFKTVFICSFCSFDYTC